MGPETTCCRDLNIEDIGSLKGDETVVSFDYGDMTVYGFLSRPDIERYLIERSQSDRGFQLKVYGPGDNNLPSHVIYGHSEN